MEDVVGFAAHVLALPLEDRLRHRRDTRGGELAFTPLLQNP